MSETVLTSPIILDATGQDMLTKLDSIISAINPVAQGVSYDNAGTGMVANNVQSAITELKTGLVNTNASLAQYGVIDLLDTVRDVYTAISASNSRLVAYRACGNIMIIDIEINTTSGITSGYVDISSLIPKAKNLFHGAVSDASNINGFAQYNQAGQFFLRLPSASFYRGQVVFIV